MNTFHYDEQENPIDTTKRPNVKTRKNLVDSEPKLEVLVNDESESVAISQKKLEGLMQLVKKNIIPRAYHHFYNGLKGSANVDDEILD